jgi:hypothetical protein
MNVSITSVFLLLVSGAVSSALLSTGYLMASFALIGVTAVAFYFQNRKEKRSQAILQDRPIY